MFSLELRFKVQHKYQLVILQAPSDERCQNQSVYITYYSRLV